MPENKSDKCNIILITIDCLRARHLGCLGYDRNVSPYIDSLAHKGILFNKAFSSAPYTNASIASILTGTYPLYKGNVFIEDRRTVSEFLKSIGYSTAAFHSNPQLILQKEYKKGFDIFEDTYKLGFDNYAKNNKAKKLQKMQTVIWNRIKNRYRIRHLLSKINFYLKNHITCPFSPATEINEKAISFLSKSSSPSFLWLHYMDTHYPYYPPKKCFDEISNKAYSLSKGMYIYQKAIDNFYTVSPEEQKYLIDMYDASIKYVDLAIGELVEKLNKMGLLDCTYIILTSDHGDEFWEHGHFGHEGHPDKIRSMKLYNEMIHVPLIVFGPRINATVKKTPISHVDLASMIVNLSNPSHNITFKGNDLINPIRAAAEKVEVVKIIAEATEPGDPVDYSKNPNKLELYSCMINEWKYIHYTSNRKDELYNLNKDPYELINLIETHPDIAEKFKSEIVKHIKSKNSSRKLMNAMKKIKVSGRI